MESRIYQDISSRTGGDIYIGVVGPVRTGKSTFIKRFMETMVLPGMENMYKRERARDELPQSGTGRTIMTAEPKFVPEEAAEITLPDGGSCRVRLVDCVGYLVEGALGSMEDDAPRMVSRAADAACGSRRNRHAPRHQRALDHRPCHHDRRLVFRHSARELYPRRAAGHSRITGARQAVPRAGQLV